MSEALLPEIGSKWVSRDPRDEGLVVTVLAVSDRFIQIQRFNKTMVRTDRFRKAYRPADDVLLEARKKAAHLCRAGECLVFAWLYITDIDAPKLPYATLIAVQAGQEALQKAGL